MIFKNPLRDLSRAAQQEASRETRIITIQKVIVTYAFDPASGPAATLDHAFAPEQTDAKLTAILMANPRADLTAFERALGIKIINVQFPPPEVSEPDDTPPKIYV